MRPTWIAAIVAVLLAAGIAAYSADSIGSTASNSGISTPNDHSSSLGSSVSSTSTNQSAAQYPLVWAPKPAGVGCDEFPFCIEAVLGFAGHTATSNITSTATTVIQDNTTTIVFESTTTYMSGVSTGVVYPPEGGSYFVSVWAFVQDAVTGQNVTTDGGQSYILGGCGIQSTGFTDCYAGAGVPPGHTYKVTVFVTKGDLPCSLRPANHPELSCTSQLLAPSQTITVGEPSTSTSTGTSTTVNSSTTSISSFGQPSCECWIPQGAPTYSVAGNGWVTAVVTYYNGFNTTVTGTAYLVIRNSAGQTVGIDNTTTTIPAGQNATLHPTVVGLLPYGTSRLPPGSYSTSVYATALNGTPISTVSIGSFNDEPLPVAFTGSDSAFGSGPVTFTLFFTNLYPSPLTGTLYGFANDTSSRSLFNATATVSLSGDSNGNATLVFSTGNINYCTLDFSFVLRAPNGTALSPYDHEGGPECPPAGSLVWAVFYTSSGSSWLVPRETQFDNKRRLERTRTDISTSRPSPV
ncbi:MAG: hypothetical protein OK456_09415 [Thaumarchaeota archaeon]|nr:hypothetical protein [Nitrososphaerota archaeon]